ncbi:MAG: CehA/McbA family metallohydrolase [Steroidobacteraceae bacterium]
MPLSIRTIAAPRLAAAAHLTTLARIAATTCVVAAILAATLNTSASYAQRQPVLKQIDLPHYYYYREMYLPQLTSGPSAVAFSPDGRTLVYSMQGSLWKQNIDSTSAEQLTDGPGYDYQPDWSADGARIAFVRYLNDALEIYSFDPSSGSVSPLTHNSAVNVEPRWSPDGRQLAWVSTAGTGHFHIFTGAPAPNGVTGAPVWPERRSNTQRYYYSAFDHELSPTWSPDGKELIYVGNPETIYGTGGLWRRELAATAQPVAVRIEETSWRARPSWSPDGKRVVYSSYAGRQWHQLWITTASGGGDPLPLSYGEFDATGARWSRDGSRIAFISNRSGTTEIWLQDMLGGAQRKLEVREKRYLHPRGDLHIQTLDGQGKPIAARVAVTASNGLAYAPEDAWIRADDGFDRRNSSFETHYFHTSGDAHIKVPAGSASVTVWRGLENQVEKRRVQVGANEMRDERITLHPLPLPSDWSKRWQSADVHVHMNYGGTYRNTPERLVRQADAEDLDVVFNLIVNKEQRIPDVGYFSPMPDSASTPAVLLSHGQEFHTSYWGHLGLLGLNDHFLIPDYAAYSNTASASLYPTNGSIADLAHAQNALVGYVHPFDEPPDPDSRAPLTNGLPTDVALGKVDYYEVVGFSDHKASAAVWYRLLNCGFRPTAAAGTDAMANYASLRGPVGMNRVYAMVAEPAAAPASRVSTWLDSLRAGRTLATNAPLLGLTVEGQPAGAEIHLTVNGESTLHYKGFLRSMVPIDHLELVINGQVARTIRPNKQRTRADFEGSTKVAGNGWILVRAWNDTAVPEVFDIYPYGTTNPVFFRTQGMGTHCGADADFFLKWLTRLEAAAAPHPAYNTPAERDATLRQISAARDVFAERR